MASLTAQTSWDPMFLQQYGPKKWPMPFVESASRQLHSQLHQFTQHWRNPQMPSGDHSAAEASLAKHGWRATRAQQRANVSLLAKKGFLETVAKLIGLAH